MNKVYESRGSDQLCQMLLIDQEGLWIWTGRLEDRELTTGFSNEEIIWTGPREVLL